MANLNLGLDVANQRENIDMAGFYCGQILSPLAGCRNAWLRFSY